MKLDMKGKVDLLVNVYMAEALLRPLKTVGMKMFDKVTRFRHTLDIDSQTSFIPDTEDV